jgi:aminoglycoside phosphotransferase (APT) family kinase protein
VVGNGASNGAVRIARRTPNLWGGRYHSEIVDCSRSDGRALRLLVKYGRSARREHNQRLGTGYEAVVYREVLRRLPMTTVKCYGAYTDRRTRDTWLVMDHIAGAAPVSRDSTQREGMIAAAAWIARFHARTRRRAPRFTEILNRYDERYCRLWARRTLRFESGPNTPWLEQVVTGFEEAAGVLTSSAQTIMHGDYYSDNVLYHRGEAYPIDWERAGVGAGEIDLACLTNGWHEELIEECERAYSEARWPHGAPRAFKKRLNAARLYVLFRLLGEARGWPDAETRAWRLDLLRAEGERIGLIEPRC